MPYQTGESLPEDKLCGRLFIPNDRQLVANVVGALLELTFAYNWEQLGAVTVDDTVTAMKTMVNDFLEDTCGDCMLEIRPLEEGCGIEYSLDGGTTWYPVGLGDCVGPQGEQGPIGPQGIQGEVGATGATGATGPQGAIGPVGPQGPVGESGTTSNPAPNPPGTPSQALRCAVARGVTQWLIEKFGDSLDAFQAAVELGQSINAAVSGMIDAIPVIGAFIDAALDYGQEIAEWDVANLKACITEEWEDAVFCNLYCELGEDGIITDTIYSNFILNCASMPLCAFGLTLIGQVFSVMCLAVGAQNARNRAYIFSTPSEDCPSCEDCPDVVLINLTYDNGSGPSQVAVGDQFTINPADSGSFGGFSQFAVHFDQCVNVKWVSSDVALRPGGGVDFYWRAGSGSPSCDGAIDTYYVTSSNPADVNSHIGETHPANYMSSTAQENRADVVLEIVSIYEP